MADKKIVSIEDRIPQLKRERKRKANRRFITYLSIIIILVLVIIYIQSPLSYVKFIDVKGNSRITEDEILQLASIEMDQNYWGIRLDTIEENVLEHPEINTVEISRKWYNGYEISVNELSRVAYVQQGENYYPILENGLTLNDNVLDHPNGDAPLLRGFDDEEVLSLLTAQLEQIPDSVNQLLSEIHWVPDDVDPYKILVYTSDGFEVIATIREFASKIKLYPSIAAQLDQNDEGIIYIDVGAYFQPFEQAESDEIDDESEEKELTEENNE